MKKNEFKFEELEVANVETEARMVPLTIGDELHFLKTSLRLAKNLLAGLHASGRTFKQMIAILPFQHLSLHDATMVLP